MGEYKSWKKLVRDLVPSQLEARGIKVIYGVIGDFLGRDHFGRQKLAEEASEVLNAKTREELVEELADLTEVRNTLMRVNGISEDELARAMLEKTQKKGAFEKFYYLDSTTEPETPADGQQ